ncbi:hypothetical protein L596_010138 [Steinernema carpocapsae]|uniref:Uncharacterized protein n=1 Tax=Steinernema carpocapsae TaxID=34508 RepID=A0A4U5PI72_STECR|nr:hypothetical protein L596_010138 [Steinernema carpocapsae]
MPYNDRRLIKKRRISPHAVSCRLEMRTPEQKEYLKPSRLDGWLSENRSLGCTGGGGRPIWSKCTVIYRFGASELYQAFLLPQRDNMNPNSLIRLPK